jgi:very-short-patch-repair endonuclease
MKIREYKHTKETRKKIGENSKLMWAKKEIRDKLIKNIRESHSKDEFKEKQRINSKEQWKNGMSQEIKDKISKSMKGRVCSPETILKMKSHIFSKEHRKNLSKSIKGRVSPMKGKHHSEETKRKIGLVHMGNVYNLGKHPSQELIEKMKNRKHSEESKKKMSQSKIGHFVSEETIKKIKELRKKQIMKPFSEETKHKMSLSAKGKIVSEKTKMKMKESRKKVICPVKDTSIEIKIQNFLKQLRIEFLTHQYMHIEHGYQCDIFIPSMNLIIECDGDYFHGNITKYNNLKEWQLNQIEEDKIRTQELISKGFKVIRLWENEIKQMNLEEFSDRIL